MIDPRLVRDILAGYSLPVMGIHGLPHWARVLDTGLRLAGRTGADARVVELFAVFHDARRGNEGIDPGHGRRGAELALRMRADLPDLDDDRLALLTAACSSHTDGEIDGDITLRTCWDADRLDLWRVGIEPRGDKLCTDAARDPEILDWTRRRSLADHCPAYVRDVWLPEDR